MYRRLCEQAPRFTDRYFPDLSNRDNALSALRALDADPQVTQTERDALREYVGDHATASQYNYRWCDECECMIGVENHVHCPNCLYPSFHGEANPDRGIQDTAVLRPCGHCGECCKALGHRMCTSCNKHITKACRHCNKCKACCTCQVCPDCNELQECNECRHCYDHCTCPARAPHPVYGKTLPAFRKNERKLFDCERFCGVEWEYNRLKTTNKYMNQWMKKWYGTIHDDASCGWEMISAPMAGDNIVHCLSSLGTFFTKSGAMADNRCSIHVHADAKDLQWADMFRLLGLYAKIEPVLYMVAGQDRLENRYCLPCGKDYAAALNRIDRKDAVMAVAFNAANGGRNGLNIPSFGRISQRERPGRRADVHRHARRRGLNILPWLAGRGPRPVTPMNLVVQPGESLQAVARRVGVSLAALSKWNKLKPGVPITAGQKLVYHKRTIAPDTTVEFRIHPNTLDAQRVIGWAKVCVRVVDWVSKHTDKDLENLPKSPLRALIEVAPDCEEWIMSRVKEWRNETKRSTGIPRRISLRGGKYGY